MQNEPPREPRRVHPLEAQPPTPPKGSEAPRRTPVTLRIPAVRPLVTYGVLVVNILIFVVRAVSPTIDFSLVEWGANNHVAVFINGELHRLFTSMFLHASIHGPFGQFAFENSLHLILNAYIIYVTGRLIEPVFGHARFALIYFLGGLTGSIASAILSAPSVFSVGASGAAFALLGAEFIYLYKHRRLFGAQARAQMQSLIWMAVINLGFGILTSVSSSGTRIDNWAHIGGAVGGLVLAWFIAPFFLVRVHPEQPTALLADDINPLKGRAGVISLYIAALLILLIIGSQFP